MTNREEAIRLAMEAGAKFQSETIIFNGKDCDDFVTRLVSLAKNEAYRDAAKIAYHEQVGCLNDSEDCCAETAGCIHVNILSKITQ